MLVVAMFLGAAGQVGLRSIFVTGATSESTAAISAADSGTQYALFRLRQNPRWRGDGNGLVIDTPELMVHEDQGNVVGYVGDRSQFRIRFNYQDGSGGGDRLPDPKRFLSTPYVSVNNIMSSSPTKVPRADGPSASVTSSSPAPYSVPEFTVCLLVEGRSGQSIVRGNFDDPEPAGRAMSTVIEGFYRVEDVSGLTLDAAAMSAKDFKAELPDGTGSVLVRAREQGGQPRLRSKGKVSVKGGDPVNYLSPDGQVLSGDSKLAANPDSTVTVDQEVKTSNFYDLSWEEVHRADPNGPSMAAGTYVWWDDGTLHFYDLNYKDYLKFAKDNKTHPGKVVNTANLAEGVSVNPSRKSLTLSNDVYVRPGASSSLDSKADPPSDFTVIPRAGAQEAPAPNLGSMGARDQSLALASILIQDRQALSDFFYEQYGASGSFNTDSNADYPEFRFSGAGTPSFRIEADANGFSLANIVAGATGSEEQKYLASILDTDSNLRTQSTEYFSNLGLLNEGALPGVDDDLTPENLALDFQPESGTTAVLSAEGNVRIGSQLNGLGGSITAGGKINIVGFGVDFSANPDAESGVSLYAKGNIGISTFKMDRVTKMGAFQDVAVKGVVYTWSDFVGRLGDKKVDRWGNFNLEGALVAYGGTPGTAEDPGAPGADGNGVVDIKAASATLTFDPAYLLGIVGSAPANLPMERTLWNRY